MNIDRSIIVTNNDNDVDNILPNVRSYPILYVLFIRGISIIIFINNPNNIPIFIFLLLILLILIFNIVLYII